MNFQKVQFDTKAHACDLLSSPLQLLQPKEETTEETTKKINLDCDRKHYLHGLQKPISNPMRYALGVILHPYTYV